MSRKGPITKNTDQIALGLAQIRIGASATHIGTLAPALVAANSIGALANTKYMGNTDWFKLESGFPLIEDYTTPIREAASLECAFKEVNPYNMALAHGLDPTDGDYASTLSGEIAIGGRTAPAYLRMEAAYTYPDGLQMMFIIFPRAQIAASIEMDLNSEDATAVPITFESKNASSDVTGGSAVWDSRPLGAIQWYATDPTD